MIKGNHFTHPKSGVDTKVRGRIPCSTKYVVYLKCLCNSYNVGKTKRKSKYRICEHDKSSLICLFLIMWIYCAIVLCSFCVSWSNITHKTLPPPLPPQFWEVFVVLIEVIYNYLSGEYSLWYCQDTWRRPSCTKHPCGNIKWINWSTVLVLFLSINILKIMYNSTLVNNSDGWENKLHFKNVTTVHIKGKGSKGICFSGFQWAQQPVRESWNRLVCLYHLTNILKTENLWVFIIRVAVSEKCLGKQLHWNSKRTCINMLLQNMINCIQVSPRVLMEKASPVDERLQNKDITEINWAFSLLQLCRAFWKCHTDLSTGCVSSFVRYTVIW